MDIPSEAKLKEIWSEVPADYYFHLNYFQKLWHEWKWLVFVDLFKRIKQPKTILEIGCAGGHLSILLSKCYPQAEVVAIDAYKPAVLEARCRFPQITFKIADAHKLPFKANSFDLVICSETIEHVVDPDQVLHEISRVMKKDGHGLIEMDSGSRLFRIIWYFWTTFGKGKVWRDAHLHPFTAKELELLIMTNGFNLEYKLYSHIGMAVSFLVSKK